MQFDCVQKHILSFVLELSVRYEVFTLKACGGEFCYLNCLRKLQPLQHLSSTDTSPPYYLDFSDLIPQDSSDAVSALRWFLK